MSSRLEIRIDDEQRRRLDDLARSRGVSVSDLVRGLLDREYEAWLLTQRLAAVKIISELCIEDVPEPDVLSRQLDETYDIPLR